MLPIKSTAPVHHPPVTTWVLIAVNCMLFLFTQPETLISQFALVPARYQEATDVADYLPFLTNMFLHGGWLHLIPNIRISPCIAIAACTTPQQAALR